MVTLEHKVLPLIKLDGLSKLSDKSAVLVLKKNHKQVCLYVDSIEGIQQTVIKHISEYLGKLDIIIASSILGTGDVTFIIDTEALINKYLESEE